eukprot:GHUV01035419.1.p1 GENE.GHUV01035419.1~~GHUV01035419.1.p1  ORF type:complete len:116 (+),score=35.00 GHUV01035419.1:523-870(+)
MHTTSNMRAGAGRESVMEPEQQECSHTEAVLLYWISVILAAVQIIADKPNYTTPAMQPTEQQLQEAHDTLSTLSNIKHTEQTPSQVFDLPMTENMEYGFFAKPLVSAGHPKSCLY